MSNDVKSVCFAYGATGVHAARDMAKLIWNYADLPNTDKVADAWSLDNAARMFLNEYGV